MVIGNNKNIEAFDSLLDSTQERDCHLSIFRYEGGLSFSILRKDLLKYILVANYSTRDTIEAAAHLEQFTGDYRSVSLVENRTPGVLVPQGLYDSNSRNEWLNSSQAPFVSHPEVEEEVIQSAKAVLLSSGQSDIRSHVERSYPMVQLHSAQAIFTEGVMTEGRYKPSHKMYVGLFGTHLYLVYLLEGTLQVSNVFTLKSTDDIAYYLLALVDQHSITPEKLEITFSGDQSSVENAMSSLSSYGMILGAASYPGAYTYSSAFSAIQPYAFYMNYIPYSCV